MMVMVFSMGTLSIIDLVIIGILGELFIALLRVLVQFLIVVWVIRVHIRNLCMVLLCLVEVSCYLLLVTLQEFQIV